MRENILLSRKSNVYICVCLLVGIGLVIQTTVISWQCPKYCVNEKTGFSYNLLYLDSVFKYKNKLVHNQAPIMDRLCPFLLNFH